MKKILSIVLMALLSLTFAFGLTACAEPEGSSGKEKGILCRTTAEGYVVYGYEDEGKNVTELDILTAVKTKYNDANAKVVEIREGAFNGNSTLTSIVVPTTVTEIDAGAFKNMKKLVKITLPFIGKTANADGELTSSAPADDKAVDAERTFGHIFGTEEYTNGAQMTFNYNATSSTTVYAPMTLREVTINAAESYTVPAYAFSGLTQLSKITFGANVTGLGERVFYKAECMKEISIPTTITSINKTAFETFNGLETINYAGAESAWIAMVGTDLVIDREVTTVKFGA